MLPAALTGMVNAGLLGGILASIRFYLNLKLARCLVPSTSVSTSWRQVPAHDFCVAQAYTNCSLAGSYRRQRLLHRVLRTGGAGDLLRLN
jgi:hypothetical protein